MEVDEPAEPPVDDKEGVKGPVKGPKGAGVRVVCGESGCKLDGWIIVHVASAARTSMLLGPAKVTLEPRPRSARIVSPGGWDKPLEVTTTNRWPLAG